jgi:DNA polymerase-3 subunit gamma/tau
MPEGFSGKVNDMELYKKYRPRNLSEVLGQDAIIKMLSEKIKSKNIPHSILFSGPSGCGKTTIARILRKHLNCEKTDFKEINCADFRGVESIREIRKRMGYKSIRGDSRIWLIDEAHQLTTDAQNAFLKILEDTPSHVYFFLATTIPGKLIKPIHTRCLDVKVSALTPKNAETLITQVCEKEGIKIAEEVREKIVECAEGLPRKILVLLESVMSAESDDEAIELLEKADAKRQAIEIARALISPKKPQWKALAKIVKEVEEEPESIRRMILAYATNVMLGGGNLSAKAFTIMAL